jgi:hypothetical protein
MNSLLSDLAHACCNKLVYLKKRFLGNKTRATTVPVRDEGLVLSDWQVRASRAIVGHYTSGRQFEFWARALTIASLTLSVAATVLSAAVLTSDSPGTGLRALTVIATSGASLLGLLQAQFNLGTRAAHHRAAGAGYSKIRRKLELLSDESGSPLQSPTFLYIEQLWDEVSHSAPIVPKRAWKFAREQYPPDLENGIHRRDLTGSRADSGFPD